MEDTGWTDDDDAAGGIQDIEWIVEGELLAALGASAVPREKQRGALRILTTCVCLLVLGMLAGRVSDAVFGEGALAFAVGLWGAVNGTILIDAAVVTWIRNARKRARLSRRS